MKITVLNGSPKGDVSVTLQYFKYMERNVTGCEFAVFNVGHEIRRIEKDPGRFERIIEEVRQSDGVLWCFPVYFALVPSQLKRFIELLFEGEKQEAFEGVYGATLTTSIHFYDHTAHNYIHAVSEDMGMRYIGGYSADMDDLMKPEERENLVRFAESLCSFIEEKRPVARGFLQVSSEALEYAPGDVKEVPKSKPGKVIILSEGRESDTNLNRMIDVFDKVSPNEVAVLDIHDIGMKGGCLGCINCGYDSVCVYKDGLADFYRSELMPADAVVCAGSIRDRYLSSTWKQFFDRTFFRGHRPMLMGKQTAYIISGPLRQIPNLRQVLEGYGEVGMMNNCGFVTDEYDDPEYISSLIEDLAKQLAWAIEKRYREPWTFLGFGGHKLFRDFIYDSKFVFKADHEFFKEHDFYDFPQKNIGRRLLNTFALPLLAVPHIHKQFKKQIKPRMIRPYQRYLED